MKRLLTIACAAVFSVSLSAQAGLFDTLKESAGRVATEVGKDLKYTVDQTLRSTFPIITDVGSPKKAPDGYKNEVVLFGFKSCPYCQKAERLLHKNRVHYVDMDVQKSKRAKKKFKKLGGRGVPVLVIGDEALHGYSEEKIMALLEKHGFLEN